MHGKGAVFLGDPEEQDGSLPWIVKVLVGQVEKHREPIPDGLHVDNNV